MNKLNINKEFIYSDINLVWLCRNPEQNIEYMKFFFIIFHNTGMKKPMNYYCYKDSIAINKLIQNQLSFEVIEKIGEGSFGIIYKVFDPRTSQLKVIKKLKKETKIQVLQEKKVLKSLQDSQGFATLSKYIQNKEEREENVIVMPCLGTNIKQLLKKQEKFNIYTTKRIGYQLVRRLEELHKRGYIHRDLKPQNVILGNQRNPHKVYLVDFGLSILYNAKAMKRKKIYDGIVGTAKYCSLSAHQGIQQFPIDDLESLGYLLVYFVKGTLPWQKQKGKTENSIFNKIYQIKSSYQQQKLCEEIHCFKKYFKKLKQLKFNSPIDYDDIAKVFEVNASQTDCFEFCPAECRPWNKEDIPKTNIIPRQPRAHKIRNSIS